MVIQSVCQAQQLKPVNKLGEVNFSTVEILILLYTNTAAGTLSQTDIDRLKGTFDLSRNFIWRNSKCQLNINLSYLVISDFKNRNFFPMSGLLQPDSVEKDLILNKVSETQLDVVATIYKSPYKMRSTGGTRIFKNKAYLYLTYPFKTNIIYPTPLSDVDNDAIWLFTSELHNTFNLLCCARDKTMGDIDDPIRYAQQSGESFSYLAELFRNFDGYLELTKKCGRIGIAQDRDNDGFVDSDVRVPVDESRFGSDPSAVDSDGDGLSDLYEFIAGIYQSTDPQKMDTDNDGYLDGHDEYPLHPFNNKIPKITPAFEKNWGTWFLFTKELDYTTENVLLGVRLNTKIYFNWDNDFLYFGCEMDAPATLHFDIDLLNNGWWHGKDNYRLVVDPYSDRFSEIHVMLAPDTIDRLRDSLKIQHYSLWDDDPEYISKYEPILDERTIELETAVYEQRYIIKMKIPNNANVPFQLQENHKIGMRIYFSADEFGTNLMWSSVYEPYAFFEIILK